jgi:hypothetical protein
MIIREAGARKGIRSASLAPLMHQAIDCVDASGQTQIADLLLHDTAASAMASATSELIEIAPGSVTKCAECF